MSETTEVVELAVPDRAVSELERYSDDLYQDSVGVDVPRDPEHYARAIAVPVVAAELRAQADRIATHSARLAQMYAHRLRVRADELEAK